MQRSSASFRKIKLENFKSNLLLFYVFREITVDEVVYFIYSLPITIVLNENLSAVIILECAQRIFIGYFGNLV